MRLRTSETEIRELLIAWVFISLAFSFAIGSGNLLLSMVISLSTIGPAFIFHELAHKVVAQRYGCWAEFRMSLQMLFFAVVIAYFSGIVFAAPGAVMISGQVTREENGKISVSGAMTNLLMAGIFASIALVSSNTYLLYQIGRFGALINAWIAAFNMIPFGPLDGKKVLAWDKSAYIATVSLAIGAIFGTGLL
ncbi:MAG: peptidase M50 [Halobacteriota archaeon]|nr:peptidase M50 [Halobacteriota archaeon]